MRLNRFLASAGLGSRRGVEEIIKAGRVRINGKVIEDLSTQVQPEDVVKVGSRVIAQEAPLYAVLNKPPGYVVSASDERQRKTIYDLLPQEWPRSFYVGRLDLESEGLLIITNDGDLSLRLTHPRFKVDKEYEVTLDKAFEPAHREKLLRGFHIIGGRAKVEAVETMAPNRLRLTLRQGIKRQIRLMLYDLGYEVETLRRVRIGPLHLGRMKLGEWRRLAPKEVAALKSGPEPEKEEKPERPARQERPAPQARTAKLKRPAKPARPPRPLRFAKPPRAEKPVRAAKAARDAQAGSSRPGAPRRK